MSEEPKTKRGNNKVSNGVVSASCAAVLAVYTAGYVRTQAAAERFAARIVERPPAVAARANSIAPEKPLDQSQPAAHQNRAETREPAPVETARIEHPKKAAKTTDASAPIVHAEVRAAQLPPALSKTAEIKHEAAPVPPPEAAPLTPAVPPPAPETASLPAPTVLIAPPVATPLAAAPASKVTSVWKDGTYRGWGYSRHGDVEAEVVIESGRIVSASISQCRTRYSCSVISHLPPEVVQRQSPEVDYVSGATQSADAFYGAVVEALNKAK